MYGKHCSLLLQRRGVSGGPPGGQPPSRLLEAVQLTAPRSQAGQAASRPASQTALQAGSVSGCHGSRVQVGHAGTQAGTRCRPSHSHVPIPSFNTPSIHPSCAIPIASLVVSRGAGLCTQAACSQLSCYASFVSLRAARQLIAPSLGGLVGGPTNSICRVVIAQQPIVAVLFCRNLWTHAALAVLQAQYFVGGVLSGNQPTE
jgi:hypothetical protein